MAEPESLNEALRLLQADPPVLLKDKKGQVGNQKTKYADLVQVNAVVLSRLNALGVIYKTKPTLRPEDPKFVLEYSLTHVPSGTQEAGQYPLKLSENPMQMGSAITYARRYVLLAITGIAAEDEDDDGQEAANRGTAHRARSERRSSAQVAQDEAAAAQRRAASTASRPPLPGEQSAPDGITAGQLKKLQAQFTAIGWTDRGDRLRAVSTIVGRQIGSSNELTQSEADRLIEALEPVTKLADPAFGLRELLDELSGGA